MKQGEVTWNTMEVIRETIALRRARLQLHNVMFPGTCASNFGAKRKENQVGRMSPFQVISKELRCFTCSSKPGHTALLRHVH